jgi:inner membrane protein
MRTSAIARLAAIGTLTILLLIPVTWIYSVVSERTERRNAAVREVSQTWGGAQLVAGPVLNIPYSVDWTDANGRPQRTTAVASILPRDVTVAARLDPEVRHRGIFAAVVYHTTLAITGHFDRPDLSWLPTAPARIEWDHATVSVGLTDPKGVTRRSELTWGATAIRFTGGATETSMFNGGIKAPVPISPDDRDVAFALTLDLNGTRDLRFATSAAETIVTLTSSWPHPSFIGRLPEQRTTTRDGFTARWAITDMARPFSSRWSSTVSNRDAFQSQVADSSFGVSLIEPVDIYHQAERAVKYALLFIVLTFLIFFLWEVFHAALLHPVQYAFVGFALCIFYLLLVSLSEHVRFDLAYTIAAIVTTLLIGAYARAVLRSLRPAFSVSAGLTALYGYLYLLLRLEDYALLAGSLGLFVVLALVMFVTRRMDWYSLRLGGTPSAT